MSRYIDADALKDEFTCDGEEWICNIIDNEPTIDAVEVKHGKWIPHPTEREWDVCSACGIGCKRREYGYDTYFVREWVTEYGYPYCPNCGADMRGKDDESD